MLKLKFFLHYLFNRERHPVFRYLFVLVSSILLMISSLLSSYPVLRSFHTHDLMDNNTFTAAVRITDHLSEEEFKKMSLDEIIDAGEEIMMSLLTDVGMADRLESYEIGYSVGFTGTSYLYLPLESNIGNLAQIDVSWREIDDRIFIYSERTEENSQYSPDIYYQNELEASIGFGSNTIIYSNPSFFTSFEKDRIMLANERFYFICHLSSFTRKDASLLYYSSDMYGEFVTTKRFRSTYNMYSSLHTDMPPYDIYLFMSECLLYLSVLLIVVFSCSSVLSRYLDYKKKDINIQTMKALGQKNSLLVLSDVISSFFYGLLGFITFVVLYSISSGINFLITGFTFIESVPVVLSLCMMLVLVLLSLFSSLLYIYIGQRKKNISVESN